MRSTHLNDTGVSLVNASDPGRGVESLFFFFGTGVEADRIRNICSHLGIGRQGLCLAFGRTVRFVEEKAAGQHDTYLMGDGDTCWASATVFFFGELLNGMSDQSIRYTSIPTHDLAAVLRGGIADSE
jgi:hypothetical protein